MFVVSKINNFFKIFLPSLNIKKYLTTRNIIVLLYLFLYKPYSNIKCNSCLEYCAYNTIFLKFLRIIYTIFGIISIIISIIINTLVTKGLNFENPKFVKKYGNGYYGIFDHKYAFSLFETTGGSYGQFSATNALYWSFPTCQENYNDSFLKIPNKFKDKIKQGYSIHRFVVHPRNKFGELFKKLIDRQKPYFLIKKEIDSERSNYYKVLLIVKNRLVKEKTLTDIWKVLEEDENGSAKIILSRKLRNYYIEKCGEPIGKGIGQGRSLFVAIDVYNNFKNIVLNN